MNYLGIILLLSAALVLGTATVVSGRTATATFAGGCFWCMESPFEGLDGVSAVISGYAGGKEKDPTYEQVSSGNTGHVEAVQVHYDPAVISYAELLDIYWKQFDPTDGTGSFYDRGPQYRPVIFYHSPEQKRQAEASRKRIERMGVFDKPLATPVEAYTAFYPAEEYHQDYYKKNPPHYKRYRTGSGRDAFIVMKWGKKGTMKYEKPDETAVRGRLNSQQYKVTQENGTERAFQNEYWDNKREGIYVDVVTGEPLFSSTDKFKSGTGWPSFTKPLDARFIHKITDRSYGMTRVEVRSKYGDSHLGHVFNDGPEPTGLRYCINSASLRFIPKEDLEKEGYGEYLRLFTEKPVYGHTD